MVLMTWEKKAQGSGSKNPMFKGFSGIDLRSIGYPEKTGPKSTCIFRRFWGRFWVSLHAEILDGNDDFLPFREPVLEVSAVDNGYPRGRFCTVPSCSKRRTEGPTLLDIDGLRVGGG